MIRQKNTHLHQALAAIKGARQTLEKPLTIAEAAKENGSNRHSISDARLLLIYGTQEEFTAVDSGKNGLASTAARIRKRMTKEQKREFMARQRAVFTNEVLENKEIARIIWSQLQPALANLSAMASPELVLSIVNGNNSRRVVVGRHLDAAHNWLKEFTHAWDEWNKSKGSSVEPGRGNEATRAEHTEPPSE